MNTTIASFLGIIPTPRGKPFNQLFQEEERSRDQNLLSAELFCGGEPVSESWFKKSFGLATYEAVRVCCYEGLDFSCDLFSRSVFTHVAVVAFLSHLGEVGLQTSLMFYLKAVFHFNKDQYAYLMAIAGIAGIASQLLLMPLMVPALGEERLLSIGCFFACVHVLLYSIAWVSWVPYLAASFSILVVFSQPCLRSITSKLVGPSEQVHLDENSATGRSVIHDLAADRGSLLAGLSSYDLLDVQGKIQGCISGVSSLADVLGPLIFSPLTALFLSEKAPFRFPGFSLMCIGFVSLVAFVQSINIRPPSPIQCLLIPGAGRRNVLIARPASVVEPIRFNVPFVPHIPYTELVYSFATWTIPILLTVVIVKPPAFSVINVKHDVLVSSVKVAEVESSTPKIVPKLPMEFLAGVYNSAAEICVAGFAMKRYLPTFKTIVYTDGKWIPSP
ncbi:Hippocampus abundant transcript 1 protein-like protein [Drosera capensis]